MVEGLGSRFLSLTTIQSVQGPTQNDGSILRSQEFSLRVVHAKPLRALLLPKRLMLPVIWPRRDLALLLLLLKEFSFMFGSRIFRASTDRPAAVNQELPGVLPCVRFAINARVVRWCGGAWISRIRKHQMGRAALLATADQPRACERFLSLLYNIRKPLQECHMSGSEKPQEICHIS